MVAIVCESDAAQRNSGAGVCLLDNTEDRFIGSLDASGLYTALNVSNLLNAENRYPASELADFKRGLIGPGRVVTLTLGYAF